ncbi:hypothetical protein CRG98_043900 [Punica granatum]|uniref:Uncharacterized protein n=1 Tax=Punica granatum TaxID=22663 RepID=A0A2I0HVM7_PUNGR|nr:hypothetical protein CRG98_043900 [Punica granatum]
MELHGRKEGVGVVKEQGTTKGGPWKVASILGLGYGGRAPRAKIHQFCWRPSFLFSFEYRKIATGSSFLFSFRLFSAREYRNLVVKIPTRHGNKLAGYDFHLIARWRHTFPFLSCIVQLPVISSKNILNLPHWGPCFFLGSDCFSLRILMKLSWPKIVKKWFNIRGKSEDFEADDVVHGGGEEEWGDIYAEPEPCSIKKSKTERLSKRSSNRLLRGKIDLKASQVTDVQNYRLVPNQPFVVLFALMEP